jgi:hypothetical protein
MEKLVRELPDAEVVVLFKRISDGCVIARPGPAVFSFPHPPATPSCQDFALPNGIEDLLGERGDLLTSLQVRSLEHNEIRIVGERSGEGQGIACIPSIDHLTARHFPII